MLFGLMITAIPACNEGFLTDPIYPTNINHLAGEFSGVCYHVVAYLHPITSMEVYEYDTTYNNVIEILQDGFHNDTTHVLEVGGPDYLSRNHIDPADLELDTIIKVRQELQVRRTVTWIPRASKMNWDLFSGSHGFNHTRSHCEYLKVF
jgi:hypothetical protein